MYHFLVRRRVRRTFAQLSRGDFEPALAGLATSFEHVFAGEHSLGGTRRSIDLFRAWFARLYRLYPDLQFEITAVAASGPPWNTVAVAEWIDRATPADGHPYENRGVHVIRLRWGRITSIHAHLDTQKAAAAAARLAASGISEAVAPPIVEADGRE